MYLGIVGGAAVLAAFVTGIYLVFILPAGDGVRVSSPARHYSSTYVSTTDSIRILYSVCLLL